MTASTRPRWRIWLIGGISLAVLAGVLTLVLSISSNGDAPIVLRGTTAHYAVSLSIDRPHSGMSQVEVEAHERDVSPAQLTEVLVAPAMPVMGHAAAPVIARPDGASRYRAEVDLMMAGQWEVDVRLSDKDGTEHTTFPVMISS